MRYVLACAVFLFAVFAAAQGAPTFESRVDSAKAMEGQKAAREYLERHLFAAMRAQMSSVMQRCLASPGASMADFTLVADIAANGSVANVAVEPATNTAGCFAGSFGKLRLPRPPKAYSSGLPIFVEMELGSSSSVR